MNQHGNTNYLRTCRAFFLKLTLVFLALLSQSSLAAVCASGEFDSGGTCMTCAAGSYCPDGINSVLCSAGTYQALTGQTSCVPAPAGSYVDTTGAISSILCSMGFYQDMSGSTSCKLAPAGTYVDGDGFAQPSPCPVGSSSPSGAFSASECLAIPDITVDLAIDFGAVYLNQGKTLTLPIRNQGLADLSISGLSLSGTHAASFTLAPGDGTGGTCGPGFPINIASLSSCTLDITFNSGVASSQSAALTIDSTSYNEPTSIVNLTAVASVQPVSAITASATELDFSVDTGPKTLTLTSSGTASLVIGTVGQTDSLAAPYVIKTDGCSGMTLPPTATCDIVVEAPAAVAAADMPTMLAGSSLAFLFMGNLVLLGTGLGRRKQIVILLALALLALASCGGGGGGSASNTPYSDTFNVPSNAASTPSLSITVKGK